MRFVWSIEIFYKLDFQEMAMAGDDKYFVYFTIDFRGSSEFEFHCFIAERMACTVNNITVDIIAFLRFFLVFLQYQNKRQNTLLPFYYAKIVLQKPPGTWWSKCQVNVLQSSRYGM